MTAVGVCGHFGELLQGRLGPRGPVALVTLPCPQIAVEARVIGRGVGIAGTPSPLHPALARRLMALLGLRWPGRVQLRARLPVGGGAGCSTAALVALARLAGWHGDPMVLARACVATEGASDPLMLSAPGRVLWASREGRVLAQVAALGRCEIVGGFFGTPVPTRHAGDFADIADLMTAWDGADLRGQAALASESARRRWPGDRVEGLAASLGALGWIAAHTGSARGLIFPPGGTPPHWRVALIEAGGHRLVSFPAGQ